MYTFIQFLQTFSNKIHVLPTHHFQIFIKFIHKHQIYTFSTTCSIPGILSFKYNHQNSFSYSTHTGYGFISRSSISISSVPIPNISYLINISFASVTISVINNTFVGVCLAHRSCFSSTAQLLRKTGISFKYLPRSHFKSHCK